MSVSYPVSSADILMNQYNHVDSNSRIYIVTWDEDDEAKFMTFDSESEAYYYANLLLQDGIDATVYSVSSHIFFYPKRKECI